MPRRNATILLAAALIAGTGAYVDPHVPRGERDKIDLSEWRKLAEPWQGAVAVTVELGRTAGGIGIDFRPPGPLVEKEEPPQETPGR